MGKTQITLKQFLSMFPTGYVYVTEGNRKLHSIGTHSQFYCFERFKLNNDKGVEIEFYNSIDDLTKVRKERDDLVEPSIKPCFIIKYEEVTSVEINTDFDGHSNFEIRSLEVTIDNISGAYIQLYFALDKTESY